MRGYVLIRQDIEDEDFQDAYTRWGISLTADTEDLEIIGEPVRYEYQFNNSNERTVIFSKDSSGKVVRECAEIAVDVFMSQSSIPDDTTVGECWDDFVDYISGEIIELKLKAGGLSNKYTLESELKPTPVYNQDGTLKILTCGVKLKQTNSYNTRT